VGQRLIAGRICDFIATGNANLNHHRVHPMKNLIVAIAVFICLPLGCAAISEHAKMEAYGRTMDSYGTAIRLSDFNAVCQYVDPAAMGRNDCLKRYENMKIVSYDVLGVTVAKDKREVTQAVNVEYYFLDRYVVKKIGYEQTWRYREEIQNWLLQTGPPNFE
jgi:hypothetical protein